MIQKHFDKPLITRMVALNIKSLLSNNYHKNWQKSTVKKALNIAHRVYSLEIIFTITAFEHLIQSLRPTVDPSTVNARPTVNGFLAGDFWDFPC